MRALLRLAIAGFVLGAVALAALALLLPRSVESEGFRATLARAVHDQLGRELSIQALTVRLLPPRVEVEAFQCLEHRELRALDPALRGALFPFDEFPLGES